MTFQLKEILYKAWLPV